MSTHTPGPWETTPRYEFVFHNAGNGRDGVVCKMACPNTPLQWAADPASLENSANARLIAAAPDLLEFVKNLRDLMYDDYRDEVWAEVRGDYCGELIAKAEGESTDE